MTDKPPDVVTVFKMLGIDVTDQTQINDFRADFVYARRLRRASEAGRRHAVKMLVTAVILGLVAALVDQVRRWVS